MPSSTSSSDRERRLVDGAALMRPGQPGDDPDVVDAYVERPLPSLNLGVTWITALVLGVCALIAWEMYWRDFGARPGYRNSDGQWTIQRRRIDHGDHDATVVIGSSRLLFDVQLDPWQQATGARPIQLALEGTSPMNVLEDLAKDQDFRGKLMVGVTPGLFFTGRGFRHGVVDYVHTETLSQRASEWLSMHWLEPNLAYYSDADFALFTVLKRQPWPPRDGVRERVAVRKLQESGADRASWMWDKVEHDPAYLAIVQSIWMQNFMPAATDPAKIEAHWQTIDAQIARAVAAVHILRDRGVPVLFVRAPSSGPYLDNERRDFPRERTWDVLLERSGARGIHFEDHAELQGLNTPEWSHLGRADAEKFTRALTAIIERDGLWRTTSP
ncbi:MAG: hypothetical protein KA505_02930 [Xanthomonadales bacterium]|nr:hypothetical protein [Xanthomonadales bacterium]MBP6077741.1 hypothetical protein [Xanthomonadales bacterium]MBP7622345.1 hypothetical protein [Xanthomonadales bacterium]